MTGRRAALRVTVAVLLGGLAGCSGPRPASPPGACTHVQSVREIRGVLVCEDAYACVRPPAGRFDRIGMHRLAACDTKQGPIVLYLPGMHMNGALPFTKPVEDFRVYLATNGVRTWSLDYRTHTVPGDATPTDLETLRRWDTNMFVADASWAADFARKGEPTGPFYLAGFSQGATLAYRLATRLKLAGLVILDGAHAGGGASQGGDGVAIDVAGGRVPYADRQLLIEAVRRDPDASSPLAGYPSAGAALADILYSAPSFGGQGGLANTRDDVSDIRSLATLLAGYDRWWPRAALGAPPPQPSASLPVLAFASTKLGPSWVDRVRASAQAFGGEHATVRELRGYGHLDVLVGSNAARDVFEPIRAWLTGSPTP